MSLTNTTDWWGMIPMIHNTEIKMKKPERDEIARQTQEFIARGGKVQEVPGHVMNGNQNMSQHEASRHRYNARMAKDLGA